MEQGQAPLFESYPDGFPGALVAGAAVNLRFFIPGEFQAAQRPRGRIQGGGKKPFVQIYMPKETIEYEERVAQHARAQLLGLEVDGDGDFVLPIESSRALITLRFNKRRPASYPGRVVDWTQKPDVDNLAKSILDGLVKGLILKDDGLITDLLIKKRFVEPGHPEGVEVDITAVPAEVP